MGRHPRKHHRFSDLPGDPHSPHVDRATGWRGALRGLAPSRCGCSSGWPVPFGLRVTMTGSLEGGLTGPLWGGAVRVFMLHHATFSINSLCHFFGRRPFATRDESRNLAWLAPIAFGRPGITITTPSRPPRAHGFGRWQLDPSRWLIAALERCHLACDVVHISPARQRAKQR